MQGQQIGARWRTAVSLATTFLVVACAEQSAPAAPDTMERAGAVATPEPAVRGNLVPQFGDAPLQLVQTRSRGTGGKTEVTDLIQLRGESRGVPLGGAFLLGQEIPETQLVFYCERQRAIGELTDFYFSFQAGCEEFNGRRATGPGGQPLDPVRVFVSPEAGLRAGYNTVPVVACQTNALDSRGRVRGIDLYTSTQLSPLCQGPVHFGQAQGRFVLILGWAPVI